MTNQDDTVHRSGFACFVGRPNVGKSTLMNALVGEKVAIMSSRPQTTRRAIRGVLSRDDAQLVVVDTPGLHRPRTLLGERLNDLVRETFAEVDVIGFCLPADEKVGPGDKWIARELSDARAPVVAIVTKVDAVSRERVAEHLLAVSQAGGLGGHRARLVGERHSGRHAGGRARAAPARGTRAVPRGCGDRRARGRTHCGTHPRGGARGRASLPHSIAVVIEEMVEPDSEDAHRDVLEIRAQLFVERESQKGIIIGRGGSRLKEVGATARAGIERLLGRRVYLDLHVKVAKDWQRDPKQARPPGVLEPLATRCGIGWHLALVVPPDATSQRGVTGSVPHRSDPPARGD
ncbi:GTPase Era [Demequina litorisediminis]|uniref:GTPase Era n=1 Tax=Demequina litorisediminis TaxID=1849022 RepID=A0ABQ6IAC1_9MICO|nr:GTPase Era [Demequina litorisediminis]